MQAAVQHILSTISATSSRAVDALGMLALSAKNNAHRQAYMSAQFDMQRKLPAFNAAFTNVLNEKVAKEINPRLGAGGRSLAATDWASLSLVDDSAVEEQVTGHRLGLEIEHECEWELRELDAYMGSLLGLGRPDPERNPIRPEVIGSSLVRAIETVSPDPAIRKTLAGELGHSLSKAMRQCYGAIVQDLSGRGIHPVGLALRGVAGPGNELPRDSHRGSGYQSTGPQTPQQAAKTLSAMFGMPAPTGFGPSGRGPLGPTSSQGGAFASRSGWQAGSGFSHTPPGGIPTGAGGMAPVADAQMLDVIRRLAFLTSTPGQLDPGTGGWSPSGHPAGVAHTGAAPLGAPASGLSGLMAVNLIRAHREELVKASSGALDHMVIDIVASLFDQILSDPKVPPQMARQIARLQLPVLRAALKDVQFFSTRSHPVRRFVNRMASVACAFEDFDEGPGKRFLALVRDLIQQVVEGDFDQMDIYDAKLRELESFVHEQVVDEAQAHAEAVALLDSKETQLRVQHRYEALLQPLLEHLPVPEFIRGFLLTGWSQVLVDAVFRHGPDSEEYQRARRAARELIQSVQPKNSPAERKQFILSLPQLMKSLNEGLARIHYPDDRKKAFFAELLPCHAQSLKGQSLTDFEQRQLDHQVQVIERLAVPSADEVPRSETPSATPVPEDNFSPAEVQQLGLVQDASIDWDGSVDIDLGSMDSSQGDIDINLDGLEPEMRPEVPTQGIQLVQHVQPGVAYQMHMEGEWKKVRLNWVSPGRTFFIFSHGKKHQEIVSLTGRMLTKLCETGRFRAFEQAYLIERAVARARKQLAALSVISRS